MNLCECGCGQEVVKRFVHGHNGRGSHRTAEVRARMSAYHSNRTPEHEANLAAALNRPRQLSDNPSSSSLHEWLNRHYPRTGACDDCGRRGFTEYSFQHHPRQHTRDRSDYRELCRSCHFRFDFAIGARSVERRTHCINGHALEGGNVRITPRGQQCVTCYRATQARYRQRRRTSA